MGIQVHRILRAASSNETAIRVTVTGSVHLWHMPRLRLAVHLNLQLKACNLSLPQGHGSPLCLELGADCESHAITVTLVICGLLSSGGTDASPEHMRRIEVSLA